MYSVCVCQSVSACLVVEEWHFQACHQSLNILGKRALKHKHTHLDRSVVRTPFLCLSRHTHTRRIFRTAIVSSSLNLCRHSGKLDLMSFQHSKQPCRKNIYSDQLTKAKAPIGQALFVTSAVIWIPFSPSR